MPRYDFRSPRLYLDQGLSPGLTVPLDRRESHYLINVLRLQPGAEVLVFNGRSGEWQARLGEAGKRRPSLMIEEQTREQPATRDLALLFAPLKHARLDYMVQKAVEMGVSRLQPVMTQHGQVTRVNRERMRANAIEAAEQCGILSLPEIGAPASLAAAVAAVGPGARLVFCDEDAEVRDPVGALTAAGCRPMPLAVCVGPEGGFSAAERAALLQVPGVVRLALGPLILRADTAAVAALALVQAVLGDWR